MSVKSLLIPELSIAYSEGTTPLWLIIILTTGGRLDINLVNGNSEEDARSITVEDGQIVYVERFWNLLDRARVMMKIDKALGLS